METPRGFECGFDLKCLLQLNYTKLQKIINFEK